MDNYIVWFIAAALMVAAELFAGTLYLLVIALGAVAGGAVSLAGGAVWMQFAVAALVAVAGFVWVRRKGRGTSDASPSTNLSLDVGQPVEVVERRVDGSLRVAYRGSQWDADLEPAAGNGPYAVKEVRGTRLLLAARKP